MSSLKGVCVGVSGGLILVAVQEGGGMCDEICELCCDKCAMSDECQIEGHTTHWRRCAWHINQRFTVKTAGTGTAGQHLITQFKGLIREQLLNGKACKS